ncbi:DNA cytosine methyltransferase [Streptomyces sp. ADI97-07]|uniref:DNA cytosine methyltransferase n=1 Tax=Streptomyces sp. ADI97-07 TaxID=1522762 RepID=UPI0024071F18|nr:DNA cytosine methyltransferase [Streptomyces sp. ADI97-07]
MQAALGGTLAWHAEVDPNASRILARHWPSVPDLGDITAVDCSMAHRVCVLTAGFPCQSRFRCRPPGRTQRPDPLRALAARRPCGRCPPTLPGCDRECARPPHLPRRFPWRRGTLPVMSGRHRRSACSAGTRCRTRIPGRSPVRREVACASCLRHRGPHRRERTFLVAWPAGHLSEDADQQHREERRLAASVETEERGHVRTWPTRVASAADPEGVRTEARALRIQTRKHPDDWAGRRLADEGRIEEGGRWRVIHLPAIADPKFGTDPLGREHGEPVPHPKIPARDTVRLRAWWADMKATSIPRTGTASPRATGSRAKARCASKPRTLERL